MLSTDSSHSRGRAGCEQSEALRDYAFNELPAGECARMEGHLRECADCAFELDRLRMTTAALRVIPDREIPQRIAFVSDKVFEPNWFARLWNSGARLGVASACVLAVALVVSAWHVAGAKRETAQVRPVVAAPALPRLEIDAAVAQAVAKVRQEDAQMIQTAVKASRERSEREYRNQLVAMGESFDALKRKLTYTYTSMVRNDEGAGQ